MRFLRTVASGAEQDQVENGLEGARVVQRHANGYKSTLSISVGCLYTKENVYEYHETLSSKICSYE